MSDVDPGSVAATLLRGHWVILSIRAAVELGVFDALKPGAAVTDLERYPAVPLEALAGRLTLGPAPLARLLSVLADIGLVATPDASTELGQSSAAGQGPQEYRLTPVGATFVDGHPSRMRDLVLMRTERPVLDSWQRLADALRTGDSVFEAVNGMDH
jgi:hypothetical protein